MGRLSLESAMVINAKHHIHTSVGQVSLAGRKRTTTTTTTREKKSCTPLLRGRLTEYVNRDAITNDYRSTTQPLTATTADHSNLSIYLSVSLSLCLPVGLSVCRSVCLESMYDKVCTVHTLLYGLANELFSESQFLESGFQLLWLNGPTNPWQRKLCSTTFVVRDLFHCQCLRRQGCKFTLQHPQLVELVGSLVSIVNVENFCQASRDASD